MTTETARLIERLNAQPGYFSDRMMAERTEADADLIDQLRADRKEAAAALTAAEATISELERLRAKVAGYIDWLDIERHKLGAVDGYDYRSGQEYGLRRAAIELNRRLTEVPEVTL